MQLSRTKYQKSFILSNKKWIRCFPWKNPVNSREKSGDITCCAGNLQQCAIAARVKPLARVCTIYAVRARIPPSVTLFATLFATRVYPAAARAALRASELERAAAARSAQLGVPPSAGRICARNARVYSRTHCARARAVFVYKMCARRPALCIRRTGPPVRACLCARSHARARTKCERTHARRRRVPAAFPHPHPPPYTPLARFGGA